MTYQHIQVPAFGEKITASKDGTLTVPDQPIIPFIEGDGIGVDVTPPMRVVTDAAVEKAYGGKRRIAWMEVYAGEKATRVYGDDVWLPDETLEETAWHFRPQALIGLYRWIAPDGTTFLRATFSGQAERHDPARSLDTGIEAAEWLSLDQIRALGDALRSPLVLRCIEDYRAGIRHPLELLQDP